MGIQWPFRHLIALRPCSLLILLKRNFMHRRILSPADQILNHPTQTAAPEHAIASAAPAASSKSPFYSLAASWGVNSLLVTANGPSGWPPRPHPSSIKGN